VLSLDDDRPSRSETTSPSLSNQRGSQHSGHDVSEDAGADPGGGKRGLSHGQIFEIVIFSNLVR
jgi:hypothetical protein